MGVGGIPLRPEERAQLPLLGSLVRAAVQRRQKRDAAADGARGRSFFDWARGGGFIADREPIDFSVWRVIGGVYRTVPDNPRSLDITIQKPAQYGASIFMMLLGLWLALRGRYQLGYYLPTREATLKFSQNRFIRLVRENKSIHALMGDPDTPHERRVIDEGSAAARRILWSIVYFSYIEGVVSTEGMPLDGLLFDEVQEMDEKVVEKTTQRVAASALKVLVRASTANFEDADINHFYKQSDQREFFTRCACTDGVNLQDCFDPADGPLCIDVGNGSTPGVPVEPFYFCPKCMTVLGPGGGPSLEHGMRVQDGRFIALRPGVRGIFGGTAYGFSWGQMLSPRISAAMIREQWLKRVDTKNFFNRILGRCYTDPKTQPVTEAHCVAAQRDYLNWGPIHPRQADGIVMGIDQMGHDNRAVIAAKVGGVMRYLHVEMILEANPWKRCAELMREYKVRVCCVEANPNFNQAHEFGREFPGRVFLVNYAELANELVMWSDRAHDEAGVKPTDEEMRCEWWARVDQYRMMSFALGRWSKLAVETPDARKLRAEIVDKEGRRVVDVFREVFWLHLQRVALVTEPIREGERKLRRAVKKIGIDPHFAYANMLMCTAWARLFGTDTMLIDEDPRDHNLASTPVKSGYTDQIKAALPEVFTGNRGGDDALRCGSCVSFDKGRSFCRFMNANVTPSMLACEGYEPIDEEEDEY